ncbi:ribonuclease H-like domain-containing protein [Xylariaceae sp. AK1471]|nr:ribonuclease H-like domain-containing protein [Xylariaceae sp. AK1471]
MVYIMVFSVDGACRGNGQPGSVGAAAACLRTRYGSKYWHRTRRLDDSYNVATNQRAEILAVIIALEWALEKYDELDSCPRLDVKIQSDSKYAIGCMTEWIWTWTNNGWRNSRGNEVANRDLIAEASNLDDRVRELGRVRYTWIPREDNADADGHCNDKLDEMEEERRRYSYSSSSSSSW